MSLDLGHGWKVEKASWQEIEPFIVTNNLSQTTDADFDLSVFEWWSATRYYPGLSDTFYLCWDESVRNGFWIQRGELNMSYCAFSSLQEFAELLLLSPDKLPLRKGENS